MMRIERNRIVSTKMTRIAMMIQRTTVPKIWESFMGTGTFPRRRGTG